jgi:hypothetical protein
VPTALDVVDGKVRELIRRRGLDPFTDPGRVFIARRGRRELTTTILSYENWRRQVACELWSRARLHWNKVRLAGRLGLRRSLQQTVHMRRKAVADAAPRLCG